MAHAIPYIIGPDGKRVVTCLSTPILDRVIKL